MPGAAPPPDQAARDRITEDLDTTLFVEAGAGSGKTSALVDRVLALVTSGRAELRADRRDHVHREGRRRAARPHPTRAREARRRRTPSGERGTAVRTALDQLDGAAIGTLHSFAQRLLSEHPIEAGLPPRVEVLDEVSSKVAFERRWSMFRDRAPRRPRPGTHDPAAARRRRPSRGAAFTGRGVRRQLGPGRGAGCPQKRPNRRRSTSCSALPWSPSDEVCAEPCQDPDDKLRSDSTRSPRGWPSWRRSPTSSTCSRPSAECRAEAARASASAASADRRRSTATSTISEPVSGRRATAWRTSAPRWRAPVPSELAAPSVASPWTRLANASEPGQLEFHDLLVLARALLRDPEHGPGSAGHTPRALPAPAPRRVSGHRPHPDRAGRSHRSRRPGKRVGGRRRGRRSR